MLPEGIWLIFLYCGDSHLNLPVLYLQGGPIIPPGPATQHVGKASPADDLSIFVALDEHVRLKMFYLKTVMNMNSLEVDMQHLMLGH